MQTCVWRRGRDLENTQFVNCQLTFDGAAQRTVAYLQNFGLMRQPENQPAPGIQTNSGVN